MSLAQAGSRVRTGIIIVLLLACSLGSFWLLQVLRRNAQENNTPIPKGKPDYVVEKFHFIRMSNTGQARYNVSGLKLTHYPEQDISDIEQPLLHSFAQTAPALVVHAKQASVDNRHNKIHLYHHVEVDRPATETQEAFHLASEYLLLLPDENIMQTDHPVVATLGQTRLTGQHMVANQVTRQLHLSGQVRGTFPPSTH